MMPKFKVRSKREARDKILEELKMPDYKKCICIKTSNYNFSKGTYFVEVSEIETAFKDKLFDNLSKTHKYKCSISWNENVEKTVEELWECIISEFEAGNMKREFDEDYTFIEYLGYSKYMIQVLVS